jgi:hypothetical protein
MVHCVGGDEGEVAGGVEEAEAARDRGPVATEERARNARRRSPGALTSSAREVSKTTLVVAIQRRRSDTRTSPRTACPWSTIKVRTSPWRDWRHRGK